MGERMTSPDVDGPWRRKTVSMWREILQDYDRRHCCNAEQQIAWFRGQRSIRRAIEVAARATDEHGRRYSHQYRIRRGTIAHATVALLGAAGAIRRATSFDALLGLIATQLQDVPGAGELYRYDTAFRIGAYLGVFPTRIHLHAGTRAGARALNLDYKKSALDLNEVPVALRHRSPHEIEDILCIYADRFAGTETVLPGCKPWRGRRRPNC